uniref:Stc1 domain-containing protein n=1 Tax=Steinernema glaseri TaxID=37863 RepID=A0A1I7Z0N8_9BILA
MTTTICSRSKRATQRQWLCVESGTMVRGGKTKENRTNRIISLARHKSDIARQGYLLKKTESEQVNRWRQDRDIRGSSESYGYDSDAAYPVNFDSSPGIHISQWSSQNEDMAVDQGAEGLPAEEGLGDDPQQLEPWQQTARQRTTQYK